MVLLCFVKTRFDRTQELDPGGEARALRKSLSLPEPLAANPGSIVGPQSQRSQSLETQLGATMVSKETEQSAGICR